VGRGRSSRTPGTTAPGAGRCCSSAAHRAVAAETSIPPGYADVRRVQCAPRARRAALPYVMIVADGDSSHLVRNAAYVCDVLDTSSCCPCCSGPAPVVQGVPLGSIDRRGACTHRPNAALHTALALIPRGASICNSIKRLAVTDQNRRLHHPLYVRLSPSRGALGTSSRK
jgi:hypothetical protein